MFVLDEFYNLKFVFISFNVFTRLMETVTNVACVSRKTVTTSLVK